VVVRINLILRVEFISLKMPGLPGEKLMKVLMIYILND
jgi:hypothetical protein